MANEIKVSTTRLGNDAGQVDSLIRAMEKELINMKTSIDQMNQMWEGPAKKSFVQAFEDDRKASEDIIKELKSLQKFETQAKKKYEQCEKQIADIISSIRI